MKFSVRTDYLFEKEPLEEQIRLAKEAGADAVEFGQMLDYDCRAAARASEKYGIPFAACGFYDMWNCRLGAPWGEIEENLRKTVECARTLGCRYLLGLAVNEPCRDEAHMAAFAENMKPAAELLEKHGLVALIEPHNTLLPNPVFDFSGYFVNTCEMGCRLVDAIGSPAVGLLLDIYHEQIMAGNLFSTLAASRSRTAHYHFSGVPGRDEPMHGEVAYRNLLAELGRLGYDGYVGLEYFPTYDARQSLRDTLAWLREA